MLLVPRNDTIVLDEYFVDSVHIGSKHQNKVDVSQYSKGDSIYIIMRFYTKTGKEWSLKQQIRFRKYDAIDCDVYNKEEGRLVFIKNSEKYPNMEYNPYLNCIDAWLVYGGCSTVFLRIHNNMLREFASVEINDGYVTVYERDNHGKNKVIKRLKAEKGEFSRYQSYKPLIEY